MTRVLVTGPTGAVGSEVLRQCLADDRVERVTAVGRRDVKLAHPKLRSLVLPDFMEVSSLAKELAEVDACFYALGVSQTQVKDPAAYRIITHDYALAAARALAAANPRARFHFVSGQGADPSMKSRVLFARVKGETEVHLRELLGDRLTVYRPGYIHPLHPRETAWWQDSISRPLYWFKPFLPGLVTDTVEVARAMMHGALGGEAPPLLENRDIRAAARAYAAGR